MLKAPFVYNKAPSTPPIPRGVPTWSSGQYQPRITSDVLPRGVFASRSCSYLQLDTGARPSGARCAAVASSSGVPKVEDVRPSLGATEQLQWDKCMEQLMALDGMEAKEAERVLAKGFGWLGQGYWRSEKVNEPPTVEQVTGNLEYLQGSLGIKGADLLKVLKAFPEVLGISKVELLEPNMDRLRSEWRMTGDVLTRALVRKPVLMGLSVDCEGICQGLCSKCWAAN